MSRRIALLGLSGVGKSTLIAKVNAQRPVLHLQASALIKAEQTYRAGHPDTSEALRLGAVLDNQALMIAAFQRMARTSSLPVVFDAHSVIDGRGGLVEIPSAVFASLGLSAICFMAVDPFVIAQRRIADVSRDRPIRTVEMLAEHQVVARRVALRIAAEIELRFIEIEDDGTNVLLKMLTS